MFNMKIFPKKLRISRKYLISAFAYRKFAKNHCSNLDFTLKSLIEQYEYETYGGTKPNIYTNGFTYGKSLVDITLAAMEKDYKIGLFTKYELYAKSPVFVKRFVKNLYSKSLYCYV